MKRVRRTFTLTETVEQLLVVSQRAVPGREDCPYCDPGSGWLTVKEAARIAGWPADSLHDLSSNDELHYRNGPGGVRLICAISLSLKLLKGDKENETHTP